MMFLDQHGMKQKPKYNELVARKTRDSARREVFSARPIDEIIAFI